MNMSQSCPLTLQVTVRRGHPPRPLHLSRAGTAIPILWRTEVTCPRALSNSTR